MPKTLSRASVVLALVAIGWVGVVVVTGLIAVAGQDDAATGKPMESNTIIGLVILAIFQASMCVLVRTGRQVARVLLTVSSALTGLLALATVVFAVLDYVDLTERAAILGGEVRITTSGIVGLVAGVLAFAGTVFGVVLLYRPSVNAYIAHVRGLRREARLPDGLG